MIKGISQLILPDITISDFFTQASGAGYQCVELVLSKEGELTLASTKADIAKIYNLSKKYDLPIVSVTHSHCTGNLLASGDEQKRSIDETIKGLVIAKELDAKCTLHTLGSMKEDIFYNEAYSNAVCSLKSIAPAARDLDVCLAVEMVWNGFLFSPLEMKKLLDDVHDEYIGFYFDPGNMAVFQYPHHWIRILGKHFKMMHLKEWKGNALDGDWPALLTGDINWVKIMAELRNIGYNGPLISEVDPALASLSETSDAIDKIISM